MDYQTPSYGRLPYRFFGKNLRRLNPTYRPYLRPKMDQGYRYNRLNLPRNNIPLKKTFKKSPWDVIGTMYTFNTKINLFVENL